MTLGSIGADPVKIILTFPPSWFCILPNTR